jgi:tripartite ATP-independent transporter DctM subunit
VDLGNLSLIVSFSVLFGLLFAGVQIGVCLAVAGMVGTFIFLGTWTPGINMLLLQATDVAGSYTLMVIPMFIALGTLGAASGITTDLFNAFYRWIGRVPGGVAVATIGTCAGMASITGSSVAVTGAMCRIALPQLRAYHYSESLSVGAIAMGGTLAIMIPPSITFVLFGIFAQESIGKLLIAGLIPGLITASMFALLIVVRCTLDPTLGPRGPRFSWRERFASLPSVVPFFIIVAAILFGILLGIWTPVESGAGGTVLVLLLAIWRRSVTLRSLILAFKDAAAISASVLIIIIGSMVFANFLALNGFSDSIARTILDWQLSPLLLFGLFVLIYVVLGCVMEVTSILALTIPLVMPIVKSVGWDPIWFGVIVVFLMEVAAVTPPVGLNLYAIKGTAPDVPLLTIYRGAIPFWLVVVACIFLLYAFPSLALYLPSLM